MSVRQRTFLTNDNGTAAVEFGLVLPGLAMLIVGTLYAGLVMYSVAGLHAAVEEGARCYSVNSGSCGSASAARSYAQSHYYGLSNPTFAASTPSCGHQVTGTVSVVLSAGIASWNIPLSTQACYP
jgi:Flp pilus assembly protein TadG